MCTAITYHTKDHYFGRNLDLERRMSKVSQQREVLYEKADKETDEDAFYQETSYEESITITPRKYPFVFRKCGEMKTHYAMLGMAFVTEDYPLYYDAVNEKGLAMAGLNFPGNADYKPEVLGLDNIAPFELIPWILGQCATLKEAEELLKRMNIIKIDFCETLPLSPLHWMIADKTGSLVVESVKSGLKIYENPVGVLTNNPPFDFMLHYLTNSMQISKEVAVNRFSEEVPLKAYSRGMGGMGLPGDLSSASRFVKAAFTKLNSVSGDTEEESVSQFFHILTSVEQQRGCVKLGENLYEITVYSSCYNIDKGIYYYVTYDSRQITGVDLHRENLESEKLISYPVLKKQIINIQNAK